MPVIDLSYAKEGKTGPDGARSIALSISGWVVGWCTFNGVSPDRLGTFRIKTHHEGHEIPNYERFRSLLQTLIKLVVDEKIQIVVSEGLATSAPLWNLPITVAMSMQLVYGSLDSWRDEIGLSKKEILKWAASITKKELTSDEEGFAIALGLAAARGRQSAEIQHKLAN